MTVAVARALATGSSVTEAAVAPVVAAATTEGPGAGRGAAVPGEAPPAGLYLHVPFCVSICPYCDFVVYAGRAARAPGNQLGAFVAALETELSLRADALDRRWGTPGAELGPLARPPLETVYLGGGTPSLLPGATIARLLELVRLRFGLVDDAEVSLEVNPGPDERGSARAFRAAGVTRLSIGAQSFDPGELATLGRRHAPSDVAATLRQARDAGIESISLDLLYDIPGGSLDAWSGSLDAAVALDPEHLSLYALTLDDPDAEGITGEHSDHLPLRPGARRWRERVQPRQDDDRAAAMYDLADRRLAAAGYRWYEISNWARPGHESRHNLGYWQGRTWEAAGPGAHAFDGVTRRWNAARLDGYLAALAPPDGSAPRLPPGGEVPGVGAADLEPDGGEGTAVGEAEAEAALLALRTSSGLPASALASARLAPALEWAMDAGLLERTTAGRLVLTLRGRFLSNEVFARLV